MDPNRPTHPVPSLSPERWRRLEPILDEALEWPPASRAALLDRACPGDPELRAQVEALLAADRAAGAFLEVPVALRAAPLPQEARDAEAGERRGERVGSYRIVREVGRGGMGAIYLAERDDGEFAQRVALKLIRRGMASDEILRRFRRERQILARLQHPHIARLLDGGVTPDGQPYFAMEYVAGLPITRYCDAHRLAIDERLRLFQSVCDAVHHAHREKVIHRDLKPSNILVDAQGRAKLVDFGIAKVLHEDAGDGETDQTRTGLRVMTPEFAAPEQVRGETITPATDVYALGAVLYELLSGQRPHQLARHTPAEIERMVCEQEPPPPSRRVVHVGTPTVKEGAGEIVDPEAIARARSTRPERLRRRLAGDLDTIVLKALAKEPERRYPTAAALGDDLRRHLAGRPVLARRTTTAYRARMFARRYRTGVGMGMCGALGIGIAVALLGARPGLPPRDGMPHDGMAAVAGAAGAAIAPTARRFYEEGLRAYHQQDLHGARRLFRAALGEDSVFALAAYYALTTEWALALPPDSALEVRLLRLAKRLPDRERLLLRGRIAWNTEDPALHAIAETLATRYPDEPEGHLLLGRAQVRGGELLAGLSHLRRVLELDSLGRRGAEADCRSCDAFATLIWAFHGLDSLTAAERTAREWVRLQPGSGGAWHSLAQVLEWQGKTEDALAAVRRMAPHAPGNPYLPIYPALLDIRAGAFEAADRLLREQARAGPPDVQTEALWFLCISLRYQGRLREALATARALRQLQPETPEPRMAEAQVLFEMGRAREAAAAFDSLAALPGRGEIERGPAARARSRSWLLTHAANARAAAGDTAALAVLADSIEVLGAQTLRGLHRRLHHHVRGLLLAARDSTAEAALEFYRATFWPLAPSSGFTRTNLELGRSLLSLGRAHEAIAVLRPALHGPLEASRLYVTHTELHALLGPAWEAAGRPDSAAVHYRWVLDAWRNADPEFHTRRDSVRVRLAALVR